MSDETIMPQSTDTLFYSVVSYVECDEIWAFISKKEGHKKKAEQNTKPSETPIASSPSNGIRSWF